MRVLITAFEPYDIWQQNSSWEALVELLQQKGAIAGVTTRRYPCDLGQLVNRLNKDLSAGYDAVLHLGQAPGASRVLLEAIALNVAGITEVAGDFFGPLVPRGPVAYRTSFPLNDWYRSLRQHGIPCSISYHAGTYLCNAILYLTHYWFEQHDLQRPVGFLHIPLTSEQTIQTMRDLPSMSKRQAAEAIGLVLDQILQSAKPISGLA
jgi:pyroglutamyl-peptidase